MRELVRNSSLRVATGVTGHLAASTARSVDMLARGDATLTHYALIWDDLESYDQDWAAASQGRPVMYGWWGTSQRTRPSPGDVAWIILPFPDRAPGIGARATIQWDENGEIWVKLDDMLPRERTVGGHWLRKEHCEEVNPGRRTAWRLSDTAGRDLEDLWRREGIGQRLRDCLTWYLQNEHATPSASLRAMKPTEIPVLGSLGGRHEDARNRRSPHCLSSRRSNSLPAANRSAGYGASIALGNSNDASCTLHSTAAILSAAPQKRAARSPRQHRTLVAFKEQPRRAISTRTAAYQSRRLG